MIMIFEMFHPNMLDQFSDKVNAEQSLYGHCLFYFIDDTKPMYAVTTKNKQNFFLSKRLFPADVKLRGPESHLEVLSFRTLLEENSVNPCLKK